MKSRTWFLSVSMLVFGTATLSMPAQTRLYILYSPRMPQAWWDYLGTSVSIAGDVNKDGFADIIMGAPTDSRGPGRAIVRSGKDGALLYILPGDSGNDQFGFSVSGAGDMDKDGFADFIVGAYFDDNKGNQSGSVRAFSGKTGKTLYTRDGDAGGDYLGQSVSGIGDVDRDGYDDFVAGASININGSQRGYVRVYSGKTGSTLHTFLGDSAGDRFGISVSGPGDVNKDGYPDVIVGASFDDNNGFDSGSARVLSGEWIDATFNQRTPKTKQILYTFNGDSAGDQFGVSVSGAGDVDKDGYADLIVGAWKDDNNGNDSGSARVFSGQTGNILYTFDGDSAADLFGVSVSGAGDVNTDGHADLIVGASFDDNNGTQSGSARVFSGKDGKTLYTLDGKAAGDRFGISVSGGADINCDGVADVVVGAREEDDTRPKVPPAPGNDAGTARVFSGNKLAFSSDVSVLALANAGKQTLTLDAGSNHAGGLYWTFGSITGIKPGVNLGGVHIPLNPDVYTDIAFGLPSPVFIGFRGMLDQSGRATASFNVPKGLPSTLPKFTLFHAYVVYNIKNNILFGSNAVPLRLF